MKYTLVIISALFVILVAVQETAMGEEKEDNPGKALFTKYKCTKCHSVSSLKLGKTKKTGAPDLSDTGNKLAGKSEWLHLFLRKKAATEKGKKHKTRFKGKEKERTELVDWLLTLKAPAAKEE